MSSSIANQVKVQKFFAKYVTPPGLHGLLYRLTGGRVGSRLPGVKPEVLLLTVQGRKTGRDRTTPLIYFRVEDQIVVAATNNGSDQHPDWYWNLTSGSDASVQIGGTRQKVRPRVATGAERDELWAEITSIHPLFAAYQEQTKRVIPMLVLAPETTGE